MLRDCVVTLRGSARRHSTFNKVEQGIQKLIKEKRVINFNTVADASGVSKAWLYKEPEIKARIEHLRQNHSQSQKVPPKQKASDASRDTIIKTLKEKIKKVEAENRGLREQLEVAYGRILSVSELEHRVERLGKENLSLKGELELYQSQLPKRLSPERGDDISLCAKRAKREISGTIRDKLAELNIDLNSTLASKIPKSTEEVVLTAIEALKEQLQHHTIRNPGGWLAEAIDKGWQPSEPISGDCSNDLFAQWYELARDCGKVIGFRKDDDGSIWVQENTGCWFSFKEFSSQWTLDYLRLRRPK